MKDWWQNLSKREQRMLAVGGIVLGLLILYYLIISPINHYLDNLQTEVASQQQLYQWMKDSEQHIKRLQQHQHPIKSIANQSLLSIVDDNVKLSKVNRFVTQLRQDNPSSVTIKFDRVPFDPLADWLRQLWLNYHIEVTSLTLVPKDFGYVQASIVFSAKQ